MSREHHKFVVKVARMLVNRKIDFRLMASDDGRVNVLMKLIKEEYDRLVKERSKYENL